MKLNQSGSILRIAICSFSMQKTRKSKESKGECRRKVSTNFSCFSAVVFGLVQGKSCSEFLRDGCSFLGTKKKPKNEQNRWTGAPCKVHALFFISKKGKGQRNNAFPPCFLLPSVPHSRSPAGATCACTFICPIFQYFFVSMRVSFQKRSERPVRKTRLA